MKHETLLKILLVMSMIGATMPMLSSFLMALFLPQLDQFYQHNQSLLPAEVFTMWQRMASIPRPYYAAMTLLYALSLAGCILMWKLRRSGFHCYALAQLLMLLLPLLFLGKGFLGLGDLMFTALFLFLYYLLLKNLGVFNAPDTPSEELDETERLED